MLISGVEEELGSLSIGTAAEVVPTRGLRIPTSGSAVARIDVVVYTEDREH